MFHKSCFSSLLFIIPLYKCEICEEENEIHFRYFLKVLRFTSHLIDWQVLWKLRKEKLCEKFRGKTNVREMIKMCQGRIQKFFRGGGSIFLYGWKNLEFGTFFFKKPLQIEERRKNLTPKTPAGCVPEMWWR